MFITPLQAAHAQLAAPAPSKVTPPVIPTAPAVPTRIILPQVLAGAAVPKGAEKLAFKLTGFKIEGEFDALVAQRRALEAPLVGKRISVAQLFDFATALQALYVRAGYPLVRVVVTPQQLGQTAQVALRVVDGFVERIDASAIDRLVRSRVALVVGRLVGKRHLTQEELERQLLIAGDAPGLVLNAVFTAGKEIGGSVLVLTGRYRAVSVSVYADNAMPAVFGRAQAVTTASLNGVFGFGEQLTVTAAGLPDGNYFGNDPTRRYLSGALDLPLWLDGLRLDVNGTDGTTTPRVDPSLASQGLLAEGSVALSYDAIKRRDRVLTLSGRLDVINQEINSLLFSPALPLNSDRLRVLRGSIEGLWNFRTFGTLVTYGATLSQGIDAFGARTEADANFFLPLSRAGANAVFTKLNGHFGVTQSLPAGFVASFTFAGQTGFGRPLLTPEQFDISGPQALSGYSTGTLVGDSAWVLRQELGRSLLVPGTAAVASPYVFGATGEVVLENPSVLEQASIHATNLGGGVRLSVAGNDIFPADVSAFIEASRQLSNDPRQDGWRLFVGSLLRY